MHIALLEDTWHGIAEITMRVEREAWALGLQLNAGKTKLMIVGDMTDKENIMVEGQIVETIEEFDIRINIALNEPCRNSYS